MYSFKGLVTLNQLTLSFLVISSIILVLIFNSNFQMGFINQNVLSIETKIIVFSIYVITFVLGSLLLLKWTYQLGKDTHQNQFYFLLIFIIYTALSLILIITILQM